MELQLLEEELLKSMSLRTLLKLNPNQLRYLPKSQVITSCIVVSFRVEPGSDPQTKTKNMPFTTLELGSFIKIKAITPIPCYFLLWTAEVDITSPVFEIQRQIPI